MNETLSDAMIRLAQNSADIMRHPVSSSGKLTTGYGVFIGDKHIVIDVVIKERKDSSLSMVWDQVWVDGKWCGNRCGGVEEFAKLATAFILENVSIYSDLGLIF